MPALITRGPDPAGSTAHTSAGREEAAVFYVSGVATRQAALDALETGDYVYFNRAYKDHAGTEPDVYCICKDLRVSGGAPTGGDGLFVVEARYRYPTPIDQVTIDTGIVRYYPRNSIVSTRVDRDINGDPLLNTAGDPFEDLPPVLRAEWEFELEFYKFYGNSYLANAAYAAYIETANDSTFMGCARGSIFCLACPAEPMPGFVSGANKLFRIRPHFVFKANWQDSRNVWHEGWRTVVKNLGYQKIQSGAKVEFTDANGVKYTTPAKLNADGTGELSPTEDPLLRDWQMYAYSDFNAMIAGLTLE